MRKVRCEFLNSKEEIEGETIDKVWCDSYPSLKGEMKRKVWCDSYLSAQGRLRVRRCTKYGVIVTINNPSRHSRSLETRKNHVAQETRQT